jgi:ATP-binding cassette subfamily F protein 3
VSFSIAHGDKIGFVGPNGAGKTPLLRIILGQEEPTAGAITRARGLRMAYLPQQPSFPSEQTLYGEMMTLYADLRAQQQRLLALADEMATAADPTAAMERYAEAEQRFDLAGGYEYENDVKRVLSGLGFDESMYEWPISVLSGGQITRALLAKLLLQEPDLLILDEPTNYLDLAALEWLENYLLAWRQTLLIVSHDRYFLDKWSTTSGICTTAAWRPIAATIPPTWCSAPIAACASSASTRPSKSSSPARRNSCAATRPASAAKRPAAERPAGNAWNASRRPRRTAA